MDRNLDKKLLDKLDIYNFYYIEKESRIDGKTGYSLSSEDENLITNASLNINDTNYLYIMQYFLNTTKSIKSRTITIDYRLLTKETIELLKSAYQNGNIEGIRIYPNDASISKEIIDMFDIPEFNNFLLTSNNITEESKYLDIRNSQNVCTIEKYRIQDNDPISESIHITRKLNNEEIHTLAEIIKKHNYEEIAVNFYEPMYYKKLLEALKKEGISKEITIKLLGNPLYDESFIYEDLDSILDNKIIIQYNTCHDLNEYNRDEPISSSIMYYSDIEASGITESSRYADMIKTFDEITTHIEEKEYSPLEKVAYIHDYFKTHYTYNYNSRNEDAHSNRDLDRVYNKDRMICSGFSNLYSALLRRAGILCFTYGTDDHQKNIIRIKDDKYGIDNLAIIDPTWDLDHDENRNVFSNFLVPIDNDLYAMEPEVINIPTALTIDNKTYFDNIDKSNPVYATDAMEYAIRMLQLMGLGNEKRNFDTIEEAYDYYKSILANSSLTEIIQSDKIVEAVMHVRKNEHEYSDEFEEENERMKIYENVNNRGNLHDIKPRIRLLEEYGGDIVEVKYFTPKKDIKIEESKNQYEKYYRPRKKLEHESNEQYIEYLEKFYHDMFYLSTVPQEEKSISIEEIEQSKMLEEYEFVTNQASEEILEEDLILGTNFKKPRGREIYETDEEYVAYLKEYYDTIFPNTESYEEENIEELNLPRKRKSDETEDEYALYLENYYGLSEEEYIPGTKFRKPRGRGDYETDEEYVEYLKEYYDNVFPNAEQVTKENDTLDEYEIDEDGFIPSEEILEDELIPGTNFRKPRGRGDYETDEEYIEFLEEYYKNIFGEEVVEQSKVGKVR